MGRFRMTYPTAMVLQALAAELRYGFEIADATGLRPGSVYQVLRRLEEADHARGEWEDADRAHRSGRPPRRYYRLRGDEVEELLSEARRRYPSLEHAPGTSPTGGTGGPAPEGRT